MISEGCTKETELFWICFRLVKKNGMCYLIDTKKPPQKEILKKTKAFQLSSVYIKIVSETKWMYRRSSNFVMWKSRLILKNCEVTNDVRYQECTEITLDFERQNKVKGYFFFSCTRFGCFFDSFPCHRRAWWWRSFRQGGSPWRSWTNPWCGFCSGNGNWVWFSDPIPLQ